MAPWCWELIEPYLKRNLINRGVERPSRRQTLEEFARVWPGFTATLGVQEPFAGTIRFKWLVRLAATEMAPFLEDPAGGSAARYGGGEGQREPPPRGALAATQKLQTPGA